jgi:hypothetical protein
MKTITILSALKSLSDLLEDQGVLEDEEVSGALATLTALCQGDAGSFDGEPIYQRQLVGVKLN